MQDELVEQGTLHEVMVALWKLDPLKQNRDLDRISQPIYERAAKAAIAELAALTQGKD